MSGYNIALIGCGRIGFLLENDSLRRKPCTHFGGIQGAGLSVTHACDIDSERLDAFIKKTEIKNNHAYTDYMDLFSNNHIDCAIIATPTPIHYQIAKKALQSGVKTIVLEKPASSSLVEAMDLIRLEKKYNSRIIVNHERRYDARYNSARNIILNGRIGKVTSVTGIMGTGPYRGKSFLSEGGGPLLHDGTHLIDIILFFFGNCSELTGSFTRENRSKGFEDTAHSWLVLNNGVNVFIESGGCKKYFSFEIDITGTEGRIQIGNGFNRLFLTKKSGLYEGFRDLEEVPFPLEEDSNCFINLYEEVKSLLEGKRIEQKSSLNDAYHSMEIIHGIYYSSWKNKKIHLPINPKKIKLKKIFNL